MSSPSEANVEAASPDANPEAFSYAAEARRKALHLLALVVPGGMIWLGHPVALYVLGPVTAAAVAADVLRAYSPGFNAFIRSVFGPLMRASELPPVGAGVRINGATSVMIGATLLAVLFPMPVAAGAFATTLIADAAAALVGRRFGRHPWPGVSHTVEGSAAFVLTGLGVIACLPSLPFAAGAAGVLAAAVAEAAPLPLNDNIRVPFVAATVIAIVELAG